MILNSTEKAGLQISTGHGSFKMTQTYDKLSALERLDHARYIWSGLIPVKAEKIETEKALLWVYRWGWSTSKIIEVVGGAKRSGLANRLIKRKLLTATKTEAGPFGGAPSLMLTLTKDGKNEVEKHLEHESDLIRYQLNPYRIDQTKIIHSGKVQLCTAKNLSGGSIVDYKTDAMRREKSQKNVKEYSAVWILKDGSKIGFDIESSQKWGDKLIKFTASCNSSINRGDVQKIIIFTQSKAIKSNYEKALRSSQLENAIEAGIIQIIHVVDFECLPSISSPNCITISATGPTPLNA